MIANVLVAIAQQDLNIPPEAAAKYKKTIENVKRTYHDKLLRNGRDDLAIGRVDFVSTRTEVETYLSKGMFDIFLCTDRLTGDRDGIGIGTIRQWAEKFPNVHTYLLLEPKRDKETKKLLNTGKLANLYIEGYYVALFVNEIVANEDEFFNVLINGRTKEEAYRYYELNDEIIGRILETKIHKKPEPVDVTAMPKEEPEIVLENDDIPDVIIPPVEKEPVVDEVLQDTGEEAEESVEESRQANLFDEIPEEHMAAGEGSNEEYMDEPDADEEEGEGEYMERPYEENEEYSGSYSPRVYLDLDSLHATATYSFEGTIGEIISDDVLIIRCPGGGLFRNKDSLKGRRIDVVIKDM